MLDIFMDVMPMDGGGFNSEVAAWCQITGRSLSEMELSLLRLMWMELVKSKNKPADPDGIVRTVSLKDPQAVKELLHSKARKPGLAKLKAKG